MKEALIHPKHPERICWGCERYCAADNLACREERLAHPIESHGYDWLESEQANATERVYSERAKNEERDPPRQ
jgi:hypothetical protein